MGNLKALVNLLNDIVVNPLLALLFGAALVVFLFGMAEFFFGLDVRGDLHAKENGRNHMIWGLIGIFIMVSAWTIITIIAGTVGNPISSMKVPPT